MTFQIAYYDNGDVEGVYFMGFTIDTDELEEMAATLGYKLVKKEGG
jgi:hypothetical protein